MGGVTPQGKAIKQNKRKYIRRYSIKAIKHRGLRGIPEPTMIKTNKNGKGEKREGLS